jgi:hypothetical protein
VAAANANVPAGAVTPPELPDELGFVAGELELMVVTSLPAQAASVTAKSTTIHRFIIFMRYFEAAAWGAQLSFFADGCAKLLLHRACCAGPWRRGASPGLAAA